MLNANMKNKSGHCNMHLHVQCKCTFKKVHVDHYTNGVLGMLVLGTVENSCIV